MGWSMDRFPFALDEDLLCGICKGVFQDVVTTSCGHTFCSTCLQVWLQRTSGQTCPHCRLSLGDGKFIPVYSLRQVVNKLCIYCENRDRGCTVISRVEEVSKHNDTCGYTQHSCSQCGESFNRKDLPQHRDVCHGRKVEDDKHDDLKNGILEKRISILEIQLKHTRKKLELCEADNKRLMRELSEAKLDIQTLSKKLNLETGLEPTLPVTDMNCTHDVSPGTISELSLLITASLRRKPLHISAEFIFHRIKQHYQKYARCGNCYEYDIHMLVATAYASNWFTGEQRVVLHHWLESIAQYRKYINIKTRATVHQNDELNQLLQD